MPMPPPGGGAPGSIREWNERVLQNFCIFFSLEIDLEIARLYLSLFCPQKNGWGIALISWRGWILCSTSLTVALLQEAEQLKNTPKNPEKTSKNRFPLYFVWDKKPTKKPKNFRPGPELKTVFIALEMKFAMIFFSARARTENSIYSFGNEVRDDRVTFPKL